MATDRILPFFCLLVAVIIGLSSGLLLDRLPRRLPAARNRFTYQDTVDDDEDFSDSGAIDTSIDEKRKVNLDNGPIGLKPSWKSFYPFPPELHSFRSQRKREARRKDAETAEKDKHELANIMKDDEDEQQEKDEEKKDEKKDLKAEKDTGSSGSKHHGKTKRQSSEEAEPKLPELEELGETEETVAPDPKFKDWLRHEYYRNMAKSFASMRRKRDGGSSAFSEKSHKSRSPMTPAIVTPDKRQQKKSVSFDEVTDNLKAIEDVLFLDALQTIKEAGEDYEDDPQKQNRITNDLSSAYDLETMRNALFRLRETLGNMEQSHDVDEGQFFRVARKRGDQCPPLDLLTSDCSTLGDIIPDGPLKRLLLHACNWHEVCYTCGEVYGLTSENCDVGFIEQSQTICRGDVPCESTASLLLLPLRQRRVFYKRSNPSVCLLDSCVEDFLKQGQ